MIPRRLRNPKIGIRRLFQHAQPLNLSFNEATAYDPEALEPKSPFQPHNQNYPPKDYSLRNYLPTRRSLSRFALVFLALVALFVYMSRPSAFDTIRAYEKGLPQHNLTEALQEIELMRNSTFLPGRRYLRFEGGLEGRGWNNVMQEAIILSYIAHLTSRSFVFSDYTWSHSPLGFTADLFSSHSTSSSFLPALVPSRIPLNAFIAGAIAGESLEGNPSLSARSVTLEFFDQVCPRSSRVVVSSKGAPMREDAGYMMQWWVKKLEEVNREPCVVISAEQVVVDDGFFGGQFRDLFPSLRASPILSEFSWSPLIYSALARNWPVLSPSSPRSFTASDSKKLDGVVAVHLRKGDFSHHCHRMKKVGAWFMGMSYFPGISSQYHFDPSSFKSNVIDSAQNANLTETEKDTMLLEYYLSHCNPDEEHIIESLRRIKQENPSARRLFLLTNGKRSWVNGLSTILRADGWEDVKSSHDLQLDEEQTYVSGAIDMAIAEKAEFFLGNGFSSLSSNVVMLRVVNGLKADSNHFF